jgi:ketosteroid isomerase-like protein
MKNLEIGARVIFASLLFAVPGCGQVSSATSTTQKGKSGLDPIIEQIHAALGEFVKGNPEPAKLVWSSHRDDVTLGNPFGPFAHGWEQVVAAMERAAANYKDGQVLGFETVSRYETPDLAYTVEIERYRARIAGKEPADVALRCTSIFRRENGGWKLVHRHADPITTVRPGESIVAK